MILNNIKLNKTYVVINGIIQQHGLAARIKEKRTKQCICIQRGNVFPLKACCL